MTLQIIERELKSLAFRAMLVILGVAVLVAMVIGMLGLVFLFRFIFAA